MAMAAPAQLPACRKPLALAWAPLANSGNLYLVSYMVL